jgi:hypothetical protein
LIWAPADAAHKIEIPKIDKQRMAADEARFVRELNWL